MSSLDKGRGSLNIDMAKHRLRAHLLDGKHEEGGHRAPSCRRNPHWEVRPSDIIHVASAPPTEERADLRAGHKSRVEHLGSNRGTSCTGGSQGATSWCGCVAWRNEYVLRHAKTCY
jgi:hypothetical protein